MSVQCAWASIHVGNVLFVVLAHDRDRQREKERGRESFESQVTQVGSDLRAVRLECRQHNGWVVQTLIANQRKRDECNYYHRTEQKWSSNTFDVAHINAIFHVNPHLRSLCYSIYLSIVSFLSTWLTKRARHQAAMLVIVFSQQSPFRYIILSLDKDVRRLKCRFIWPAGGKRKPKMLPFVLPSPSLYKQSVRDAY